ncbi:MAG: GPW/gp25 family protein [Bacteroidales bacterium]|nr:GPW/gp25 family protein [Clostridium sp.]MCM1203302.1 GPW/gp25 family protein [Bacteroidales bacterium]
MGDFQSEHAFLGNGWGFPVTTDELTGRVKESAYEENIKESIYLIVMTRKGERVMRPDFGCDIHQYMFAAINYTTLTMMKHAVQEALLKWEPRITELQVEIADRVQENNAVQIMIAYRVRTTNTPFNLVFPFYLEET